MTDVQATDAIRALTEAYKAHLLPHSEAERIIGDLVRMHWPNYHCIPEKRPEGLNRDA
jgi:hypothetical protein